MKTRMKRRVSESKKPKVWSLGLSGVHPQEISKRLKIPVKTVVNWLVEGRKQGLPIKRFNFHDKEDRNTPKVIRLRTDIAAVAELEAQARGYRSAALFINELLRIMADDHLFDAVFDTQDGA